MSTPLIDQVRVAWLTKLAEDTTLDPVLLGALTSVLTENPAAKRDELVEALEKALEGTA